MTPEEKYRDYEKRWVLLGNLLEMERNRERDPIQFRSTVITDVLNIMVSINKAERNIMQKHEDGIVP
jgi:hypothetical protein